MLHVLNILIDPKYFIDALFHFDCFLNISTQGIGLRFCVYKRTLILCALVDFDDVSLEDANFRRPSQHYLTDETQYCRYILSVKI